MTSLPVVLTTTAKRHFETIEAWWDQHRRDAPELFPDEVEAAFRRIAQAPSSGAPYLAATRGLRRVLLRRTRHHVYCTHDVEMGCVVVRAIWHTAQGRRPSLS